MSDIKKNKQEVKQEPKQEEVEVDGDQRAAEEKWKPTPEVFEAFLARDEKLAAGNLRLVLSRSRNPSTLKELRSSLLHSNETIDRVLSQALKSGLVKEVKGEYSWV